MPMLHWGISIAIPPPGRENLRQSRSEIFSPSLSAAPKMETEDGLLHFYWYGISFVNMIVSSPPGTSLLRHHWGPEA